jgi:hypothetical protein
VGLIEDHKVVPKQIPAGAVVLGIRRTIEDEKKEGVVCVDHIRGDEALARLLVKTARVAAATLGRANVRLGTDLGPHAAVGFD